EPDGAIWRAPAFPQTTYRFCANAEHDACNWLVPSAAAEPFCVACRHNATIPNLSDEKNLIAWRKLEDAKHRLFYTLLRLRLPVESRADDPAHGLIFEFLADAPTPSGPKVLTGHDEG